MVGDRWFAIGYKNSDEMKCEFTDIIYIGVD